MNQTSQTLILAKRRENRVEGKIAPEFDLHFTTQMGPTDECTLERLETSAIPTRHRCDLGHGDVGIGRIGRSDLKLIEQHCGLVESVQPPEGKHQSTKRRRIGRVPLQHLPVEADLSRVTPETLFGPGEADAEIGILRGILE